MMENKSYLSLGSNIGDRENFLKIAISKLCSDDLRIVKSSGIYETDPQNFRNQRKFLNCAVAVETRLDPFQLLAFCQKIEGEIGKNKLIPFGPRNIDIDILTFNGSEIASPSLVIPHPRMCERNFVLTPLMEIAPDFKINGKTMDQLLLNCASQKVSPFRPKFSKT
jgi:2-amino-4-hydroxy-6-hydroxymethyldihydropteridine diphosphokinase